MFVYILMRKHTRYQLDAAELVDVYGVRADAFAVKDYKNKLHDAVQPYKYYVVKKKVK